MIRDKHETTAADPMGVYQQEGAYDASLVLRCRIDGGTFDRDAHKALLKLEPFIGSPLQPSELLDALESGNIHCASSKAHADAHALKAAGTDIDSQRTIDETLREFVGRIAGRPVPWELSGEELTEFTDLEQVAGSAHVTVRWIVERLANRG